MSSPRTRRVAALAACAASVALSRPCFATADDEAAAAALFDRGLSDMMAGKFATACPALSESFRLDPRAGSLFTLAECEAKAGRVATASVHYAEYLERYKSLSVREQERQRERHDIAARQVEALKPQIALLAISPPAGAPGTLIIQRDGSALGKASVGAELPVDPGEHVIVIRFPGGAPRETRVELAAGEHKRVVLEMPPPPPPAPRTTVVAVPGPRRIPAVTWIAGGVGLAGVAVGSVFGGLTVAKKSTIDAHCVGDICDSEGKSAADDASTTGTLSTVGFAVGGVGLVTAAVFFLTAPRTVRYTTALAPHLSAGPGGGSLGMVGTW